VCYRAAESSIAGDTQRRTKQYRSDRTLSLTSRRAGLLVFSVALVAADTDRSRDLPAGYHVLPAGTDTSLVSDLVFCVQHRKFSEWGVAKLRTDIQALAETVSHRQSELHGVCAKTLLIVTERKAQTMTTENIGRKNLIIEDLVRKCPPTHLITPESLRRGLNT